MLNRLKELNEIPVFDVFSEAFREYGRVIEGVDVGEIKQAAERIEKPAEGAAYTPSEASFESLAIASQITDLLFGTLPTQIGYCHGHNTMLNATEWHTSSEVNVAITPLVLILGKRSDMQEGRLDSATMKAFYVPENTVLEVYATSLHFTPCQVSDSGFGCVVALPAGTNTPLEGAVADKLLFRKNKWIVAHNENAALIQRGVVAGICGKNFEIKY